MIRPRMAFVVLFSAVGLVVIAAEPDERVLMISVDGMMPTSYTTSAAKTTTLHALAADGSFTQGVVGVLPSVTYPSHTTLMTGVTPDVRVQRVPHRRVQNRGPAPRTTPNATFGPIIRSENARQFGFSARFTF